MKVYQVHIINDEEYYSSSIFESEDDAKKCIDVLIQDQINEHDDLEFRLVVTEKATNQDYKVSMYLDDQETDDESWYYAYIGETVVIESCSTKD